MTRARISPAILALAVAITLFVPACGARQSSSLMPAGSSSAQNPQIYPEPQSAADQEAITRFLEGRPSTRGDWLFYTASHHFYASTPALLASAQEYSPIDATGSLLASRSGEIVVAPPQIPQPTSGISPMNSFDTNSGALRGAMFAPNYDQFSSYVNMPCSAANLTVNNNKPYDTAYIYSGGWGSDGFSIDAGVQYSPKNNNYNLFIKQENQNQISGAVVGCNLDSLLWVYSSGANIYVYVTWSHNPAGCNVVEDGSTTFCTSYTGVSLGQQITDVNGGWNQISGIQLKRVASVAEPMGNNTFTNGDFFGLAKCGSKGAYYPCNSTPLITWSAPADLCNDQPAPNGCFPISASYVQHYACWPNDITRILVNYTDAADEADAIYLKAGAAGQPCS